jgi:hypothetical protein
MCMNKLMFSAIQSLTKDQIFQISTDIFDTVGIEEKEVVWRQLHDLLISTTPTQLYGLRQSYFKWYASLSWDLLYTIDKKNVFSILDKTFVCAVKEDIAVWKKCITYLHLNTLDQNDMQSVYNTIRETLLHSKQVVCVVRGQELTLEGFFDSLLRYEEVEDGLELAQFLADVVAGMSVDITEMNYVTDPAKAVDALRDFAHFLSGVKPNRIFVVVDAHMYPQKYERLEANVLEGGTEIGGLGDEVEVVVSMPQVVVENDVIPEQDFNVFSYINDAAGTDLVQEVEATEILSLLQTLSGEKNNPRIADAYFFNEQTGAFAWDEALLKELKLIPEDFDMSVVDEDKKEV